MIYFYFCEGTTFLRVLKTYAKKNFTYGNKKKLYPFTYVAKYQPIHRTVCVRNIMVLSMESPGLRSLTHITNFFEKKQP